MSKKTILTLVGSLRAGSTNLQLAEAIALNAPEQVDVVIHESLGNIPFYNEDIDVEGQVPAAAAALRAAANEADTILLVTPEHNGTVPASLKNAIDWLSRPFGAGALVRQAHRGCRNRLWPVRRRMGPGRGPQGRRHRRRPGPRERQARSPGLDGPLRRGPPQGRRRSCRADQGRVRRTGRGSRCGSGVSYRTPHSAPDTSRAPGSRVLPGAPGRPEHPRRFSPGILWKQSFPPRQHG